MTKYNEIRLDKNGNEDDIVIQCDSIHIERMDNNAWWIGVYKGSKRNTMWLKATAEGIMCETHENELNTKVIDYRENE